VLEIVERDAGTGLDPDCCAALRQVFRSGVLPEQPEVPAAAVVPALSEDYFQAA
jgi:hypothetical protein